MGLEGKGEKRAFKKKARRPSGGRLEQREKTKMWESAAI